MSTLKVMLISLIAAGVMSSCGKQNWDVYDVTVVITHTVIDHKTGSLTVYETRKDTVNLRLTELDLAIRDNHLKNGYSTVAKDVKCFSILKYKLQVHERI